MQKKVSVIGQGYVGLPLSITLSENGFKVFGIDANEKLVATLNQGLSHIEDVDAARISNQLVTGNYQASSDYEMVSSSEVIIVCVPTPLLKNRTPDLTYLIDSITSISKYIRAKSMLIIESTVAPGTTRNIIVPMIEKIFGPIAGNIDIVYSPERVDPNNSIWNIKNTPKLLSGLSTDSTKNAKEFYSAFVTNIVECSSFEVAETAKLLENTFRLVNISFINEFRAFCEKLHIDVTEVINAAATKPYGYMPFYPSIGVGGHCIPVDPIYLAQKAEEIGAPSEFIELADKINRSIPEYFVEKATEAISGLAGKFILVVGVAYKPNVADTRETPVADLIVILKQKGAKVAWHDDLVKEWNGERSTPLSNLFDLAIIATPHDYLDLTKLGDVKILNTRGQTE
jgi:UDP-N-acetyl-D-glucosamine dehydrogenase